MEDAPWKFVAVATGTFSEAVPWRQHASFLVVSCVVYTSEGNREKNG
jgi:hypothetical protein